MESTLPQALAFFFYRNRPLPQFHSKRSNNSYLCCVRKLKFKLPPTSFRSQWVKYQPTPGSLRAGCITPRWLRWLYTSVTSWETEHICWLADLLIYLLLNFHWRHQYKCVYYFFCDNCTRWFEYLILTRNIQLWTNANTSFIAVARYLLVYASQRKAHHVQRMVFPHS